MGIFDSNGYTRPLIVFWNLTKDPAAKGFFAVRKNEQGVVLLSGFSKLTLNHVLGAKGAQQLNSRWLFERMICDSEYSKLAIFD
jgi:hypothetical protein